MRYRKPLFIDVLILPYAVTWIGSWNSRSRDLTHEAEESFRSIELLNQERADEANRLGIKPFLIPLHRDGPVAKLSCVPLIPGILLERWESSHAPMGGGGGNKLVFYYVIGSIEICKLGGGWRN